jgi:hypothetical protein
MAEAYILITCEEGHEEKIINELTKINDILITDRVRGPYNILVKIKGETIDTVIKTITSEIKTIDKIQYTVTLKVRHNNR